MLVRCSATRAAAAEFATAAGFFVFSTGLLATKRRGRGIVDEVPRATVFCRCCSITRAAAEPTPTNVIACRLFAIDSMLAASDLSRVGTLSSVSDISMFATSSNSSLLKEIT